MTLLFTSICSSLIGRFGDMRSTPCFRSQIIYGRSEWGARTCTPNTSKTEPRKHRFLDEFIDLYSFVMLYSDPKTFKLVINLTVLACYRLPKKDPNTRPNTYPKEGTQKWLHLPPTLTQQAIRTEPTINRCFVFCVHVLLFGRFVFISLYLVFFALALFVSLSIWLTVSVYFMLFLSPRLPNH